MQILIKLQPFKRLQHFLHNFLQILYMILIINLQILLRNQYILLLNSLLLLFNQRLKNPRLIIFTLNPFIPQVDHRSQLTYWFNPRLNFPQYFRNLLIQSLFQHFTLQIACLCLSGCVLRWSLGLSGRFIILVAIFFEDLVISRVLIIC